jgi:Na+/proline symporter
VEYSYEEKKIGEVSEIKNYLIAGGNMNAIPIAFSLLATNFSGNVLLGYPAEIYEYGTQFWLTMFGIAATPFIGAFLTGPLFLRLNVMSVFEYLKVRYNSNLIRQIGVFCYFIRIVLSTAMYIYGPSTTVNSISNIDGTWSIILIGFVATFYTTIGGIR